MKAEADEAEARACAARAESDAKNMRIGSDGKMVLADNRLVVVQPFDHCDPAHRFDEDLSEQCKTDLQKILSENTGSKFLDRLLKIKAWKKTCDDHVDQAVEPELTRMYFTWRDANMAAPIAAAVPKTDAQGFVASDGAVLANAAPASPGGR